MHQFVTVDEQPRVVQATRWTARDALADGDRDNSRDTGCGDRVEHEDAAGREDSAHLGD